MVAKPHTARALMSRARVLVAPPRARDAVIARARGPRSRADLVRVAPCAGEMLRPGGALGTAASDTSRSIDDEDEDDARARDDVPRRTFFATNVVGALAACASACADAVTAAEEVPKDYAKLARELVDALTTSLEYEAANADKSPGERFKFAEPAKKAVKAYISYDGGNGSAAGTETYADISEALRELSAFYKRNGATTAVSDEVREKILSRLYEARDLLPPPEPTIMDKLLNLKKDE